MSWFKWNVYTSEQSEKVGITPPIQIDVEYDDLILWVTGNILIEDKVKLAQKICDQLNSIDDLLEYKYMYEELCK